MRLSVAFERRSVRSVERQLPPSPACRVINQVIALRHAIIQMSLKIFDCKEWKEWNKFATFPCCEFLAYPTKNKMATTYGRQVMINNQFNFVIVSAALSWFNVEFYLHQQRALSSLLNIFRACPAENLTAFVNWLRQRKIKIYFAIPLRNFCRKMLII